MFVYEKRLQYPIKIKNTNPKLAALIISQYGGPYSIRLRKSRSGFAPAFAILHHGVDLGNPLPRYSRRTRPSPGTACLGR